MFVGSGSGGYIQRPFESHGERFVQRTYIRAGIALSRFYRPWTGQNVEYDFYVRSHYHRPAFYAWAGSPFQHPCACRWGWEELPWYGQSVTYFTPDPSYASPAAWLVDFTVGTTLQWAYVAEYDYGTGPSSQDASIPAASALTAEASHLALSPQGKRVLGEEIRRQMKQAKPEEEAWAMPALFTDHGPRVFLVPAPMTGVTSGNAEILLGGGAVLGVTATPDPKDVTTMVKVLAARESGCPLGSSLMVRTEDLVEALSQMEAIVDHRGWKNSRRTPQTPSRAWPAFRTRPPMPGLYDQDQWAAAAARIKVRMDTDDVEPASGQTRPPSLWAG